jgi:hypothetical protein
MPAQKYSVNQHPIQTLLTWIESKEIAIPEIQRPFVWDATKVRDLLDSLLNGFPVGYLIAWRNPTVKLKDGSSSTGKRILIDGQQRVTALTAALLGRSIINKDYQRTKIIIAFHPLERRFEVTNPLIRKDKAWLPDISEVLSSDTEVPDLVDKYCELNPEANKNDIYRSIEALRGIVNNPIGLIELNSDLDIAVVTEIFIRINSQGTTLSQADFAMSKIAANEQYGGNTLRKVIDYFCHLAVAPEFYDQIVEVDSEFAGNGYLQNMAWMRKENDDLYDPSYTDMLRVAFTSEFKRGKLQDLVALLSGRNFETRDYEEAIAEDSFKRLEKGTLNFINETNFKRFLMILRSAGFIDSSLTRSQNALNFAYIVYLILREKKEYSGKIESYVRKWYVMSVISGRYSASPESKFDEDIRRIDELGFARYFENVESAEMSEVRWSSALPQQLNTSVASSPLFKIFLAAQVKLGDKGFLSKDITVADLITHRGDVHHVFPRGYLKTKGLTRSQYNQIANYVMMQSEINIAVGNKSPKDYFTQLNQQCSGGKLKYGAICEPDELKENFKMNCIPAGMEVRELQHYDEFLEERRKLMSGRIRLYYASL